MKAKKILMFSFFAAASALVTSCVQKNYYVTNPSGSYQHNNNDTGYNYTFDEEFNGEDNYGWAFTDAADSAYASVTNGNYQYVDYSASQSSMSTVNTGASTSGDFTVQTRIKSNNNMALIFGASSSDNGYAFYVDTAGNYSLYKEGTGTTVSTTVIASTADSQAVKNGYNTLEIDQKNGQWTGYIDDKQVFQITAQSLSGTNFGFKVLPATVGYADYLVVKSNK